MQERETKKQVNYELISYQLNEKYIQLKQIYDYELDMHIDPLLATYDKEIEAVKKKYVFKILSLRSHQERRKVAQEMEAEKEIAANKLFEAAKKYTDAYDRKVKVLNQKMLFAKAILLERIITDGSVS